MIGMDKPKRGRPPIANPRQHVTLRLAGETVDRLKRYCAETGTKGIGVAIDAIVAADARQHGLL